MQLPEYFIQLYNYNCWANQLSLSTAEALSPEQFFAAQSQSWGSVQQTLVHIMNAEWIWLPRWKGHSFREWLPFDDFPTVAAIKVCWENIQQEQRDFVALQTTESLQRTASYTNTQGQACQAPLWLLMSQVVNHGTHHRSELAAMFSSLGVPHQDNDLYYYYLAQSGQMKE